MMSAALADAAGAGDAPMEGSVQETCSGDAADSGEAVAGTWSGAHEDKEGRANVGWQEQRQQRQQGQGASQGCGQL